MAEERVQRRLAAILAADVVGYSRMMRENEAGTLAQLKTHRIEVFDPRIAEHSGRIVKTTGDGVLVEFASAVDATECAIKIQRSLARQWALRKQNIHGPYPVRRLHVRELKPGSPDSLLPDPPPRGSPATPRAR